MAKTTIKTTQRYYCYECEQTFNNPDRVEEVRDTISLGGVTYGYTETMWYCPHCGGEGFAEIGDDDLNNESVFIILNN